MLRLVYLILLGLLGAGIVHIVVLFLLPSYSDRDVWSRLSAVASPYETVRLGRDKAGAGVPVPANPFIRAAACRFDLADGALHMEAAGSVPFWSLSLYDDNGLNIFSISDRAATDRALDVVVANRAQMQKVRAQPPAEFARSLFMEVDMEEGIALVRVLVPDETWDLVVDGFLAGLDCKPRNVG